MPFRSVGCGCMRRRSRIAVPPWTMWWIERRSERGSNHAGSAGCEFGAGPDDRRAHLGRRRAADMVAGRERAFQGKLLQRVRFDERRKRLELTQVELREVAPFVRGMAHGA